MRDQKAKSERCSIALRRKLLNERLHADRYANAARAERCTHTVKIREGNALSTATRKAEFASSLATPNACKCSHACAYVADHKLCRRYINRSTVSHQPLDCRRTLHQP